MGTLAIDFDRLQRIKERGLALNFVNGYWVVKEKGEPVLMCRQGWLAKDLYIRLRDA